MNFSSTITILDILGAMNDSMTHLENRSLSPGGVRKVSLLPLLSHEVEMICK